MEEDTQGRKEGRKEDISSVRKHAQETTFTFVSSQINLDDSVRSRLKLQQRSAAGSEHQQNRRKHFVI